jgi:plasmid stabilization system protein ParE
MAYRIIWTRGAINRLQGIYNYYYEHASDLVADKVVDGIIERANQLESFPDSVPIEQTIKKYKGGYRYLVYTHYKILYKFKRSRVSIVAVVDTRQNPLKY